MNDQKSSPVQGFATRYMVVKGLLGGYNVLDTFSKSFGTVCKCGMSEDAHHIAKLMNEAEDFWYVG